ncbi:metallophosphoesterase [Bacillota bacterium Lsc_1132]
MKQISFIHAADLHLDSPMAGLRTLPDPIFKRVRESTFQALKKLTDAAIEKKVDFVILAGDLFDGEDRSLKAQSRLRSEMQRLALHGIPVYVIHGNHDHLGGSWVKLEMPENVHIFSSDIEVKVLYTKSGAVVHLYGFSYPQRHVLERKIFGYQIVNGADYHIGILHGNEEGSKEHNNYAPFTVKELLEKPFDYWALGHIHKRAILAEHPPVVYPGNTQGRSLKETGAKGCYFVAMTPFETKLEFIETAQVIWEEAAIDVQEANSFQEIYRSCQNAVAKCRKKGVGTLLMLTLKNVRLADYSERKAAAELQELLAEDEEDTDSFVWIMHLEIEDESTINREQLEAEGEFYRELFATGEHYKNPEKALAPLYEHLLGRKYLPALSSEEQQELLTKAENLLVALLYKP